MNVGTLSIMLMANTTGLVAGTRAVYRMERAMSSASTSMNASMAASGAAAAMFGRNLTQFVTLPVTLIGVLAVKSFSDFEYALAKVNGLIGISKEQVAGFGSEILKLGSSLGRLPKELSEALYTVTTSGMRGADVMEVLTLSTKGAIAGLGSVAQVADITTSAMNAYGKENLSAARTLDIVTATVREGKAEANKLITSMGVATPIASKLGVSFDQVGAAMAAMTRTGTVTSTSATQLRQMLFTMIKPSEMTKRKMKEMGSSFGELRKILREDGLIAALEKVQEVTGGLPENMAAVFRNVRALSGVTDIMGEHFEENVALFDRIANSSGNLNNAFIAVSETVKIRLTKITARWQEQMIKLGEFLSAGLIPILEKVMWSIEGIGKVFAAMPSWLQSFLAGFIGLVAVVAPLVLIFVGLKTAIVALGVAFGGLGLSNIVATFGAMGLTAAPLWLIIGEIVLIIGALVVAYKALKFAFFDASNASKYFKEAIENANISVIEERQHIQSLIQILNSNVVSLEDKADALDRLKLINTEYFGALTMESALTDEATKSAENYIQTLINLEKIKNIIDAKQKVSQDFITEVAKPKREIGGNTQFDLTMRYFDQLKQNKFLKEKEREFKKYNVQLVEAIDNTKNFTYFQEKLNSLLNNTKVGENPLKGFEQTKVIENELKDVIKTLQAVQVESGGMEDRLTAYRKVLEDVVDWQKTFSELAGLNDEQAFLDPEDLQKMNDYVDELTHIQILLGYLGKEYDSVGASISVYMKMLDESIYSDEQKQGFANIILDLKKQQEATAKTKQEQDRLTDSITNYKNALNEISVKQKLFGATFDATNDRLSALKTRYDDLAKGAKRATPEMQRLAEAIMNIEFATLMGGKMARTQPFQNLQKGQTNNPQLISGDLLGLPDQMVRRKQPLEDMSKWMEENAKDAAEWAKEIEAANKQAADSAAYLEDLNVKIEAIGIGGSFNLGLIDDKLRLLKQSLREEMAVPFNEDWLTNVTEASKKIDELTAKQDIYNALASGLADTFVAIGEAAGNAFAGVDNAFQGLLISLLGIVKQIGEVLIGVGTAMLFIPALQGTGLKYIVGGIAIVALASGISAAVAKNNSGAANMAEGGIIPGGYPNDTFSANLSSNEAVIPLEKLPQLLGIGRSGKKQKVEFIIEGRVLKGILKDADMMYGIR